MWSVTVDVTLGKWRKSRDGSGMNYNTSSFRAVLDTWCIRVIQTKDRSAGLDGREKKRKLTTSGKFRGSETDKAVVNYQ